MSNQDLNDPWPILHISSDTFHQWKLVIFAIFVCLSVCHVPFNYSFTLLLSWRAAHHSSHLAVHLLFVYICLSDVDVVISKERRLTTVSCYVDMLKMDRYKPAECSPCSQKCKQGYEK